MAKSTSNLDRPICVATVFGKDEVEVTRSFLRAYGIITLEAQAGSYGDAQWPRGTGASPILVPASQARDAIDLLRSTDEDQATDDEASDHERERPEPETADAGVFSRWWGVLTAPFSSTEETVAHVPKRIIHDLPADFGKDDEA